MLPNVYLTCSSCKKEQPIARVILSWSALLFYSRCHCNEDGINVMWPSSNFIPLGYETFLVYDVLQESVNNFHLFEFENEDTIKDSVRESSFVSNIMSISERIAYS